MTIYESVNKGIAFIEANLENDIGVADVANAVCYSQFYFSREFSRYTHLSVYDYIMRRKLSESYKRLFKTGERIADLAFRYGFQSHEVYTRAFKKMFHENPSSAAVYKPLALQEPIDDSYLTFLNGLKAEFNMHAEVPICFEADALGDFSDGKSSLVLLDKENFYSCKCIFFGQPVYENSASLCFPLKGLSHKARLYHHDVKLAFRYFIEHCYDVEEMVINYILVANGADGIDFFVPTAQ